MAVDQVTSVENDEQTVVARLEDAEQALIIAAERRRHSGPGGIRYWLRVVGPVAAVFVVFIGGWYALRYWIVTNPRQRFLVPAPHDVVSDGILDGDTMSEVLKGFANTGKVAVIGFLIAAAIGIAIATIMSQAKWFERAVYPYAVVLQTIPIIALVPIIGQFFDYSENSRIIVTALIALFPLITNTLFGLQSADQGLHDLFTLHGAGRLTRLRKLMFPAALPAMFTGFRISAGLAVIGAIVGDFFFRQGGNTIGRLIEKYRNQLQYEEMYVAILFSSVLGIMMFWFFGWLGRRVTRHWHEATGASGV